MELAWHPDGSRRLPALGRGVRVRVDRPSSRPTNRTLAGEQGLGIDVAAQSNVLLSELSGERLDFGVLIADLAL
jgi:hypothetical protein